MLVTERLLSVSVSGRMCLRTFPQYCVCKALVYESVILFLSHILSRGPRMDSERVQGHSRSVFLPCVPSCSAPFFCGCCSSYCLVCSGSFSAHRSKHRFAGGPGPLTSDVFFRRVWSSLFRSGRGALFSLASFSEIFFIN